MKVVQLRRRAWTIRLAEVVSLMRKKRFYYVWGPAWWRAGQISRMKSNENYFGPRRLKTANQN